MEKKLIILLAVLAIALVLGAGIFLSKENNTSDSKDNSGTKVKNQSTIRYLSIPGGVQPFEIAEKLGYLKEEGIILNRVGTGGAGPENIMGLSSNSIDLGHTTLNSVINAKASGVKIKIVVAGGASQVKNANGELEPMGGLLVLNKSGINSASDLKGKTIGVPDRGGHADLDLRIYFKKNGINPNDVQLVVIPSPNLLQALKQGQVDGIYPCGSFFSKGLEDSDTKLLTHHVDLVGVVATCGYSFTEDYIKNNPEIVEGFVRAYVKAWDWSLDKPKEYQAIVAEILKEQGGNPDLAKYTFPQNRVHALFEDRDVQLVIDYFVDEGKIKPGQIAPSTVYTNEFNPYKG